MLYYAGLFQKNSIYYWSRKHEFFDGREEGLLYMYVSYTMIVSRHEVLYSSNAMLTLKKHVYICNIFGSLPTHG